MTKPIEYLKTAISEGWFNIWAWGFTIEYNIAEYEAAVTQYRGDSYVPSHEEVLTKIMEMGGKLYFKDWEGRLSKSLDLSGLTEAIENVPSQVIESFDSDSYDADTTNEFLQYVLFNKKIFA
jgi:hypothetical protein